jgi:hypothetical protein
LSGRAGWVAAIVCGTVLWGVASLSLGHREPWDAPSYWTIWYPAAILLCAVLGALFPARPWRWPFAVMLIQLPVMTFVAGSGVSLLPLGTILCLVLALPGILAAATGAFLKRRLAPT